MEGERGEREGESNRVAGQRDKERAMGGEKEIERGDERDEERGRDRQRDGVRRGDRKGRRNT